MMKEEWLMPGAIVPVTPETVVALITEIKRLIDVVGDMALNQRREWVGLTEEDMPDGEDPMYDDARFIAGMVWASNKLREKNA